jgi:hypothetical protein
MQGTFLVKPTPRAFMDTQTWIDALAVCGYAGGLTPPSEIQFYLQLEVARRNAEEVIYRFKGVPEVPWQEVQGTYVESNAVDAPKLGKDIERRFGCLRLERDDTTVTVAGSEPNTVEVISFEEYGTRMERANEYFRSYNTWCHSHVKMTATPSGTDNTQWEEWKSAFTDSPVCAMLIFNLDGQLFVRIRDAEIGRELEAIPVQLLDPGFSQGLTEVCKSRVRPKATTYSSQQWQGYGTSKSSSSSKSDSTKTPISLSSPPLFDAYRKLFDTFGTYSTFRPTVNVQEELVGAATCIEAVDDACELIEDFQKSQGMKSFGHASTTYTPFDLLSVCEWRTPMLGLYGKMLEAQAYKHRTDSLYRVFLCFFECFYDTQNVRKLETEKQVYSYFVNQEYSYTFSNATVNDLHKDEVFLHFLNFSHLLGTFLFRKDATTTATEATVVVNSLKAVLTQVLSIEYITSICETIKQNSVTTHPNRAKFAAHLNDQNITTHSFMVYFYAFQLATFMVSPDALSQRMLTDTVNILIDSFKNDVFRLTYIFESGSDSVPSGGSVQKALTTSLVPVPDTAEKDDQNPFAGWEEFAAGLA